MSATNRGRERANNDYYSTPQWVVHRFLDKCSSLYNVNDGITFLDPCAGDGAIIKAVRNYYISPPKFLAVELTNNLDLLAVEPTASINTSFFDWKQPDKVVDLIITNPPYSLAMEFIQKSIEVATLTAMLLRVNFLGAKHRQEWMQAHPPDIYVLPNRPSFKYKGNDATEYAWFVWNKFDFVRRRGSMEILDKTPDEVRKAEKQLQPR